MSSRVAVAVAAGPRTQVGLVFVVVLAGGVIVVVGESVLRGACQLEPVVLVVPYALHQRVQLVREGGEGLEEEK